ncbi:tRNA (adenosine(37)-N6)-threonylcarbamoyltransferase complex dimerization subunit type 1 TsaB [Bartonella sp. DGB1]|uniref:tRNA (adenosine(37)-N6)-threonylcarbamoyltransferase complex dimerization subunit type 1 TsaB n=1 Tax=Bartonella sp. DGB1 TaxID=3239807 RepID=UPI00352328A9
MIILSIDTIDSHCKVCLSKNSHILSYKIIPLNKGHAEFLLPLIEQLINASKISLTDINLISVNIGPGSFTGIRVGVSVARALSLGLKCSVMGISLFDLLAYDMTLQDASVTDLLVVLPSNKADFYVANYIFDQKYKILQLKNKPLLLADIEEIKLLITNSNNIMVLNKDDNIFTQIKANYFTPTTNNFILHQANLAYITPIEYRQSALPLYMREPDAKYK